MIRLKALKGLGASKKPSIWQDHRQEWIWAADESWLHWAPQTLVAGEGSVPEVLIQTSTPRTFNPSKPSIFPQCPVIRTQRRRCTWNHNEICTGMAYFMEKGESGYLLILLTFFQLCSSYLTLQPPSFKHVNMGTTESLTNKYAVSRLTRSILIYSCGFLVPCISLFISKELMRNGQLLLCFKREICKETTESNSIDFLSWTQGTIKHSEFISCVFFCMKRDNSRVHLWLFSMSFGTGRCRGLELVDVWDITSHSFQCQ